VAESEILSRFDHPSLLTILSHEYLYWKAVYFQHVTIRKIRRMRLHVRSA